MINITHNRLQQLFGIVIENKRHASTKLLINQAFNELTELLKDEGVSQEQKPPLQKPEFDNILLHANHIIFERGEEKDREYGPIDESMDKAAKFATMLCNKEITTEDFYKCMVSLKLSRLSYNCKQDTYLDGIGYLAALSNFKLKEENE